MATVEDIYVPKQQCFVTSTYQQYFVAGLTKAETLIKEQVVSGFDKIGLAPLGGTVNINSIVNFTDLFNHLFGDEAERNFLSDIMNFDAVEWLNDRIANIHGSLPMLNVTCGLERTPDLGNSTTDVPHRMSLRFRLDGSLTGGDIDLTTLGLDPKVAVLPEDIFPPLDLTLHSLTADYSITFPMTIDWKYKFVILGDLKIKLDTTFGASIEQPIPILKSVSQTFAGSLALRAGFEWSLRTEPHWQYYGSYEANLAAETSVGANFANMALIVKDSDFFDDKPPDVVFDFDICEYADLLYKSVESISFKDEISTMIDKHFGPVLEKTFLPQNFTDPLKAAIATAASNKVNSVKSSLTNEFINFATSCGRRRRRLSEEVAQYGSQRNLKQDLTFNSLTLSFEVKGLEGVVS